MLMLRYLPPRPPLALLPLPLARLPLARLVPLTDLPPAFVPA